MINGKKVVCVIPARMQSTRLPEKPLKEILGLPMIVHVMKRAEMCNEIDEVYVATDSKEIKDVVEKHKGKCILTKKEHATGTDRIGEAIQDIDCDIVVNVQGDEPLVKPEHISKGIKAVGDGINVSCLCVETNQLDNVDEVKLVMNEKNEIMYFSRADLPSNLRIKRDLVLKQYCIYSFRRKFLLEYLEWEQTPLEKIESVELLRVLEKGHRIKGVEIKGDIVQSVDTPEDLELVRKLMEKDDLLKKYK